MQQDALYFPYVHIRDEEWLKVASLYWLTLRRLVPRGYAKHDGATARALADAELLLDEDPTYLLTDVTWDLLGYLRANEAALLHEFSIQRALENWDGRNWSDGPERESPSPLGWIHVTKFPRDVLHYLEDLGLVRMGRHGAYVEDPSIVFDWVGMHPVLAGAYMTALAQRLGQLGHFEPLTDQADLRVAAPSSDVNGALKLLTGKDTANSSADTGIGTYVMLALQYALPKNLNDIPVETIIECRRDLREELADFRGFVDSQQTELAELATVPMRRRRIESFATHVAQTIEVPLRRLERGLALHRLEPTRALLVAGSVAPPVALGAALTAAQSPAAVTAAGTVAAIGDAWWQIERQRSSARVASPVGYLLDVRDRLTPKTLAGRVRKVLRGTYGRA